MDTIKNILGKPGAAQDDEINAPASHAGLGGEGSHFAQAKNTIYSNPSAAQENENLSGSTKHAGLGGEGTHFAQARTAAVNPTPTDPLVSSSTTDSAPKTVTNSSQADSAAAPTQGSFNMPGAYPASPYSSKEADPMLGSTAYTGTTPSGVSSSYYRSPAGTAVPDLQSSAAADPAPSRVSHSSRGAALGSGGAALTGLEERRLAGDHGTGSATTNNPAETFDSVSDQPGATGHHYGRDAAVGGAGLVGAAALGKHEYDKHGTNGRNADVVSDGAADEISGPHSSEFRNRRDPIVESKRAANTSTTQQPTTQPFVDSGRDHHYGRDAAVGGVGLAGAAALGKHELDKKEAEKTAAGVTETGSASITTGSQHDFMNKAYPKVDSVAEAGAATQLPPSAVGASTLPQPEATQSRVIAEKHHHYGRDAAVGGAGLAGAAALGKHEHDKYGEEKTVTTAAGTENVPIITGPQDDFMNTANPKAGSKAEADAATQSTPSAAGVSARSEPAATQSTLPGEEDHHYGRDAAVGGAGLAGAAALGKHEHDKHEKEKRRDSATGLVHAPNTSGPHRFDWMNRIDPLVDHKAGLETSNEPQSPAVNAKDHHYERDAAGVGAGSLGLHEVSKHHNEKELEKAEATSGVPSQTTRTSENKDHHYGRDAAGLGATGLGAHEVSKHHQEKELEKAQPASATQGIASTHGMTISDATIKELPRGNDYGKDIKDPRYGMSMEGAPHNLAGERVGHERGHGGKGASHDYGRDAMAAGVVGAGVYEAEMHHKHDKDLTAEEKEEKREHKHELREEKKHRHDVKEEQKRRSGGILSFLHRDKNKKYSKEEEDEFDRQEREQGSHMGRDAALGGAVVGAGAYEAEKHHHGHQSGPTGTMTATGDTMKPLPTVPGDNGMDWAEETQKALADRTRISGTHEHGQIPAAATDTDHQVGRDAALLGGAGAVAAHNHREDGQETINTEGLTLGDKERNRDMSHGEFASSNVIQSSEHHLGQDAAVGAGAAGAAENGHHKRNVLRKDPPPGYGATSHGNVSTAPLTTTDPETGLPTGGKGSAAVSGSERVQEATKEFW